MAHTRMKIPNIPNLGGHTILRFGSSSNVLVDQATEHVAASDADATGRGSVIKVRIGLEKGLIGERFGHPVRHAGGSRDVRHPLADTPCPNSLLGGGGSLVGVIALEGCKFGLNAN
jgi:hypothetical protein